MGAIKLIINADDFGCAPSINQSIACAFKQGLINSTTMIVILPGFEDGIRLAKLQGFDKQIGLHLNITDGKSITDLSGTGLTDELGQFLRNSVCKNDFFLDNVLRSKIKEELDAQYHKLVSYGITPTHFDSHHHIHTKPKLVTLFVEFAKEKNIALRIAAVDNKKNLFKAIYKTLLNRYYKIKRVNFSDVFCNVESINAYRGKENNISEVIEIMVHPILNKDNKLYDDFSNECLTDLLPVIISKYSLN